MSKSNPKLRTASDVMSRLRWDTHYDPSEICVGYTDRILGPMEKALCDFQVGGDIPEHRIQYFRFSETTTELLWDRVSRQDCIFGSGAGPGGPPNTSTLEDIGKAAATMTRIEEERRERKADKLRKLQRRRTKHQILIRHNAENSVRPSTDRHVWSTINVVKEQPSTPINHTVKSGLTVVTWNVLFDTYETEPSEARWLNCISMLKTTEADVIALQEVTPKFAKLLFQEAWVNERYGSSTGVDLSSVDPHGNLLLWSSSTFRLHSGYLCSDGDRHRAVIAALRHGNAMVIFANVHLPADKALVSNLEENGTEPTHEQRRKARRRELAAVVAKLQALESKFRRDKEQVVCLIAGDFNLVQEEDEVFDGYFSATSSRTPVFFKDTWLGCAPEGDLGHTYDPSHNSRAAAVSRRPPRRLDRVFCGSCTASESLLYSKAGCLIGKLDTSEAPPSDHYGVKIELEWSNELDCTPAAANLQPKTAWSSMSPVTSDTLVAILLDPTVDVGSPLSNFYDVQSTLPVPHITLLHGFVELPNAESRDHALNIIREAIAKSVQVTDPKLVFDGLSVFEHHMSATLVAQPEPSSWLRNLYDALLAAFPQCHYQESRFEGGWNPHVSLGSFGSAAEARTAIKEIPWTSIKVNAPSLVIYKRDPGDGLFYALSSVPLCLHNKLDSSASVVRDNGLRLWHDMYGSSVPVLCEVQRACDWVIGAMHAGAKARICPYGSHIMEASLYGYSDVDALLEITVSSAKDFDAKKESEILTHLADRLQWLYPKSKTRVRCAGAPGESTIYLLTTKLWSTTPSLDLQLCIKDSDGNHLTPQSEQAERGLEDSQYLITQVNEQFKDASLYKSALRLIKLWAHRRQIYNAQTGFLGGGGWAILLASVLREDEAAQEAYLNESVQSVIRRFFTVMLPIANERATVDLVDIDDSSDPAPSGTCWIVRAPLSRGNLARNSAPSTVSTICNEIQRARDLLEADDSNFNAVFDQYTWKEDAGGNVLVLETSILDPTLTQRRADIKAWACRQMISIVVSLDREHEGCARPTGIHKPLRSPDSFRFLIFLSSTISRKFLYSLCRDFNSKHGQSTDIGCKAELRVESSDSIHHLLS